MASPFELVITRLQNIGAFQFLFPFMLTAAVFYGLVRKSKIFGEPEQNVAVNAIVALVAAFMVWAYPVLVGVNVEKELATFFFNASISILTVVVGLMIAGLFFKPDLAEQISSKFRTGKLFGVVLLFGILVGGGVAISSGLVNVFFPPIIMLNISEDVLITTALLVILAVILIAIILPFGGGEKKS